MADPQTSDLEKGNKEKDIADPQIHDARDWASSGDPGNAENWPFLVKAFPTALVGAIAFLWYVQNHGRKIFLLYMEPLFKSTYPVAVPIPSVSFICRLKHARYETDSESFCALVFGLEKRTFSLLKATSYTVGIKFQAPLIQ